MSPETYYKVVFLLLARDSVAMGDLDKPVKAKYDYSDQIKMAPLLYNSSVTLKKRFNLLF